MGKFFLALLLCAIVSYLLGSCNSAIIVVKLLKGEDVRSKGSKNAGLTNTFRCYGAVPALLTLIGDLAKGIIAVIFSRLILNGLDTGLIDLMNSLGIDWQPLSDGHNTIFIGYIAGFFAILGHIFPIYYGFKGGKGVLVASSILLVIDPMTFCIVIPFFIIVLAITRYVSVASISSAIAYPIITLISQTLRSSFTSQEAILHTILVVGTSIILIYMHRSNIERLKNGTENKFHIKKNKEA
ncbi:MAG: glycerol-3-phosphate 1-O-acyltransferase PlsY [Ruminococcus sp.]|nr:glycerol-3-phosphate 1-O-acyltransferase PlsY [Ruminococcus sp.]